MADMKKYTIETTVGIFVVIGLALIAYMTVTLGRISFFGANTYTLSARFTTVSGLRVGSTVDMYGIGIGRVERLGMDQKGEQALVEMSIRKDVVVYRDAIAAIKTEGLIGDRYISIDPGGADEPLKPGDAITETQSPVDILDLIGKYAFGEVKKEDQNNTEKKP